MDKRRDMIILVVLFLALVLFTIFGPARSSDESLSSTPTTHSSAPGGALALLRWTQALGYDARRLEYRAFEIDDKTDALFLFNPSEAINRTQADAILDWVDQGGTLILADNRSVLFAGNNTLLQKLDIQIGRYNDNLDIIERAPVVQPVLNAPPVHDILVRTGYVLQTSLDDAVHLVGLPAKDESSSSTNQHTEGTTPQKNLTSRAIVIGIKHGEGYIYISSAVFPFTNQGLQDDQNSALVLNLLRRVPPHGQILFDEWHHGFFTPPSLRSIVLSHPWGRALVYVLVILTAYFILTGRRFGRPIPLIQEVALRSTSEYVESMADLYQRGNTRDFILHHYYTSFKRRVAKPYGINPHLDDRVFVTEVHRACDMDETALLTMLNRLHQQRVSEENLVRTVVDAEEFLVASNIQKRMA